MSRINHQGPTKLRNTRDLDTGGYAIRTETVHLAGTGPGWLQADSLLGTVRIRATGVDPARPLFVGIAPAAAAGRYLSGVDHAMLTSASGVRPSYDLRPGTAPAVAPAEAGIWTAQASGTGTVELAWKVRPGSWSVVLANASGAPGVQARTDAGATLPALGRLAFGLLVAGLALLAAGAVLIAVPIARASREGSGRMRGDPR